MDPHERAFAESFVKRDRVERILMCLSNRKKRHKFVRELAHHGIYFLAPECLRNIKPSQQNPDSIFAILRGLDAPDTCRLISEDTKLDGKEMDLLPALKEVVGGGMGTAISCLPGRLGYFEGELRERYILQNDLFPAPRL
jgi:hypothetical protein